MEPLLNLRDLLQHEVEDLYSAEEQIIEALPKMVEKATDKELKKALSDHLAVTRNQKDRLDKIKKLMGTENGAQKGFLARMFGNGTKCKGTEGLITEGEKMMGEKMDTAVMDAAIIASAQKIEHYEISGYGTARAWAAELGMTEVAQLLETTLNEEYGADDSLTALALRKVNLNAGGSKTVGKRNQKDTSGPGNNSQQSRAQQKGSAATKKSSQKAPAKKSSAPKNSATKSSAKKAAVKSAASKKVR